LQIRVITKLPNSEQSYKGKIKTHNYINRQNQSQQPENCENRNDPDLVQAFLKKWWVESDFKAPNLPLSLRFKRVIKTRKSKKDRQQNGKTKKQRSTKHETKNRVTQKPGVNSGAPDW
jgi:hypothetical protein